MRADREGETGFIGVATGEEGSRAGPEARAGTGLGAEFRFAVAVSAFHAERLRAYREAHGGKSPSGDETSV